MRSQRNWTHVRAGRNLRRHCKHFRKSAKKKILSGKRFLITAGPTRERIDPVRFISNFSSGKMGYALAEAAVEMGAKTTLISGPTELRIPGGVKLIKIESTEQLHQAVESEFDHCDCLVMAAAPADYGPVAIVNSKIKKSSDELSLSLRPTVDILKSLQAKKRSDQRIIGFALETENGLANARGKLVDKNLDAIVLNHPTENTGFNSDTNQVTVIRRDNEPEPIPLLPKTQLAVKILEMVVDIL